MLHQYQITDFKPLHASSLPLIEHSRQQYLAQTTFIHHMRYLPASSTNQSIFPTITAS